MNHIHTRKTHRSSTVFCVFVCTHNKPLTRTTCSRRERRGKENIYIYVIRKRVASFEKIKCICHGIGGFGYICFPKMHSHCVYFLSCYCVPKCVCAAGSDSCCCFTSIWCTYLLKHTFLFFPSLFHSLTHSLTHWLKLFY